MKIFRLGNSTQELHFALVFFIIMELHCVLSLVIMMMLRLGNTFRKMKDFVFIATIDSRYEKKRLDFENIRVIRAIKDC